MTAADGYKILIDTIKNDRKHPDYKRVTELADTYQMLITGNGIDMELKRFNPREDEVMFNQRKQLTIAITPAVVSSLKKPFNKVPRTQPVTRKISAISDKNKKAVVEIEERIKSFYGSDNNIGGLDYYLQNRFTDLSFKDPNAWVIIEFDTFNSETEKAKPRPFEALSKQAINYQLTNNIIDWLIVELDIVYQEQDGKEIISKEGKKYTIYCENDAVTLTQTAEEDKNRILQVPGEELISIEKKGVFIVNYFNTLTEKVPAFRVGYIPDSETDGRTYVNPFHDALCYFKKSIKQGSEYDLSTCLHTFPQKIVRLTKTCPGEKGQRCDRGYLTSGEKCNICNGTGRPIHTSGQDIIEVELPDSKDDLVSLTDYVYYVPLPIELLKIQKQWVDDLKIDCHQTVFNSTALLKSTFGGQDTGGAPVAVTATQQNDNMESVYDTLSPFAEKVSAVWQTIVWFIAVLTDNKDKVSIIHRFPSNFKMKTRNDLYLERKVLNEAGAPSFVLDSVDEELAEEVYADDADMLFRYKVKRMHYPFSGKTNAEIQQLLSSTFVLKKTKILYAYYDDILKSLEREYAKSGKDFYLENFDVRQEKINTELDKFMEAIDGENQTAFNFKMNKMLPDNTGNA